MINTKLKEIKGRIYEAKKDSSGKISYPVILIYQGLGNLADRNYYTEEAIKTGPAVYEGKKAYYDHPTPDDENQMPNRSVKEICGHYENCKAEKDKNGLFYLKAEFVPMKSKSDVIDLIEHSIEYAKKYKDEDQQFVGISINGDGEGDRMDYEEFLKEVEPNEVEMEKIKQVEGQQINVIKKFTSAVSADIVTEAGAKGRILQESNKKRRKKMLEAMKKFLFGAEKEDKKLMEEAVKDMLQSEDEDETKKKKAEAYEAEIGKKAEDLAKGLLAAKKETKKDEGESESEWEARCMKQAMMKQSEDEKKEAADKDEAEKKEKKEDFPPKKDDKKDDGDGDDDSKDKKEKKHEDKKEDEDESEDGDDKDKKEDKGDDDKGHDDADQDKKLIKKMMKQMDEMKKEIEGLKKEKKESEDEGKKHQEESAKNKVELETKKRIELVESILAESGLPRYATKNLKELCLKARSKEEMKKFVETAKEVHTKAIESAFYGHTVGGFVEISTENKPVITDSLFK